MPDAARWQRVKNVFEAARQRPPEERPAFLDEAAGDDGELRREVVSLLAAEQEAGGFLSRPAAVPEDCELEGRRIGPYRVLGSIGRGGMGAVYRAVRDDDAFEKTVAVKLVHAGAGPRYLERLAKERQILARLQHPHIATILDGGTTEDGQPYLVMEYVEGQPFDVYCAARGLGTSERLEMFRAICGAVHYAHQNLVVHRDLKPGNILVTPDGQPKLLDFGIAKLLSAGVEPEEAPTATLLPMMTPEYASPEQVRGLPVTTATDVYSLGVVLYELLSGQRPVSIRTDSLAEIVRSVCETEPPLPSEAARERRPGTARTVPWSALRGDLDTIVMKALRKEPERRYQSALELSEDVRRHLVGLPVLARGDTFGYRVSKFVGRHKAAVAATALVALSVISGLVLTVHQAHRAEASRRQAEQRFGEVRRLANFVMFDMHDAIARLPGSTPARKQLVEKSLEYLDRLAGEASSDPALLEEIAAGYERLSQVQGDSANANLGDAAAAIQSARKATALRESVTAAKPANASAAASLAKSYGHLAGLLRTKDRTAADAALLKMKAALDAVPSRDAGQAAVLEGWELYSFTRSNFAVADGDLGSARESRRRQVEVAEKLLALAPENATRQRNVAVAYKYYGGVLQEQRELQAAGELYEKARVLDQTLVDKDPSNPHRRLDLSFSLASIGALRRDQGDLDGALSAYGSALELRQALHAEDPADQFAFRSLVRGHETVAGVWARKGEVASALSHARQALELSRRWEEGHPSPRGPRLREAAFHGFAGDLSATAAKATPPSARRREHRARAREEYARAIAIWTELARDKPLEADETKRLDQLKEAMARVRSADAPDPGLSLRGSPPPSPR